MASAISDFPGTKCPNPGEIPTVRKSLTGSTKAIKAS
jgi:hypothetical protein